VLYSEAGQVARVAKEQSAMSFQQAVPSNIRELKDNLEALRQGRDHVKGAVVNMTNCHLEIELDWAAHNFGHKPDFFIPLKRSKINDAKILVDHMVTELKQGLSPADPEVQQLWDMIDITAK
jgi:hypothetical protein